jgi:hypothetical protein
MLYLMALLAGVLSAPAKVRPSRVQAGERRPESADSAERR